MSQPQRQPEWNVQAQRYLYSEWNAQQGRYCWKHYVEGQGWKDFDWGLLSQQTTQVQGKNRPIHQAHMRSDSLQSLATATQDEHQGGVTQGTYSSVYSQMGQSYGQLDSSFCVRTGTFFEEGRVFSMLFTEAASGNSKQAQHNDSLSQIRYGEYVFTHIRRFVVVKRRREFCFAIPIFSYGSRGTTKPGVNPDEHAIIYSDGYSPHLVVGEAPLKKSPIRVVMTEYQHPLATACRVYFGIHHPIQYNVKVKDVGIVHGDDLPLLLSYWHSTIYDGPQSDHPDFMQDLNSSISSLISVPKAKPDFDDVTNPRKFFKKDRIFMTPWTEPSGSSGTPFTKAARFVVVRPGSTFSVCLRISTYSGQGTTKPGVIANQYAAVIPQGNQVVLHEKGEDLSKEPIEIKVENPDVDVNAMSRINFAKPYTIEHNVKVRNIGRVVGDSVKKLERYFAESLGFAKPSFESS